jgi:hypothetical protein
MYIEVNIAADGALRPLDASNFGAFKIVVTEGHDADTVRELARTSTGSPS